MSVRTVYTPTEMPKAELFGIGFEPVLEYGGWTDNPENHDNNEQNLSCDCCIKGWDIANEFGLCVCCCFRCNSLLKDCRYKCLLTNSN